MLAARQWVADSIRQQIDWTSMPEPLGLDAVALGNRCWSDGIACGTCGTNSTTMDDFRARIDNARLFGQSCSGESTAF